MGSFSSKLLDWYYQGPRELPWKKNKDPYQIWISEIILQQTRVAQGTPYYHRFLAKFPSIKTLANAHEDEVLQVWQGLGYYSRARNMHAAAKQIKDLFNGIFPSNYKDILSLKGVGPYTAAAISSFAYDQPYAVVDGNVIRVLTRFKGIQEDVSSGKTIKGIQHLAQEFLDVNNPSDYNQAIMDFGALHCKSQNPLCESCIYKNDCYANQNGLVDRLPFKSKRTKTKTRYIHHFDIRMDGKLVLRKRGNKDIWAGLYDFLTMDGEKSQRLKSSEIKDYLSDKFSSVFEKSEVEFVTKIKHVLTHRIIEAFFYRIEIEKTPDLLNELDFVEQKKISNFAVSTLLQKYLDVQE